MIDDEKTEEKAEGEVEVTEETETPENGDTQTEGTSDGPDKTE